MYTQRPSFKGSEGDRALLNILHEALTNIYMDLLNMDKSSGVSTWPIHAISHVDGGADEVDHDTLLNAAGLLYGHDDIDVHIDDLTIHFTKASIDHTGILNAGTSLHVPTGGSSGQFLKTDGATPPSLSWDTPPLAAHATSHESGGSDEIAHDDLSGAGTNSHSTIDSHLSSTTIHVPATGGSSGQCLKTDGATPQNLSWGAPAPAAHASTHEDGGSDEITHDDLDGAGTNSHATIDSHIASTSVHVPSGGSDGDHLKTNGSGTLSWEAPPSAGTGFTYVEDTIFDASDGNAPTSLTDLDTGLGSGRKLVLFRITDLQTLGVGTGVWAGVTKGESGSFSDWAAGGGGGVHRCAIPNYGSKGYAIVMTDTNGYIQHAISSSGKNIQVDVVGYIG